MFDLKFLTEKKTEKYAIPENLTLAQVREAMLDLMAHENVNHHRMGQYYNYVVDRKLAEAAGYKDARDYFTQNLVDLSPSALSMYAAVALAFTEQISVRFGVTCLYLLLIYKEAADIQVNHAEPGDTVIEVPDKKGVAVPKPFSKCSVSEMREAIRRKRKPASSKPLPDADLTLADQYHRAVTSSISREAPLHMQVRNYKGEAVMDFKGVPLKEMFVFGKALTSELPPPAAVPQIEQAVPGKTAKAK